MIAIKTYFMGPTNHRGAIHGLARLDKRAGQRGPASLAGDLMTARLLARFACEAFAALFVGAAFASPVIFLLYL